MYRISPYDDETTALLYDAYDAAWLEWEARHSVAASAGRTATIKTGLTKGLLAAAQDGERDPERLKLAALEGID